MAESAFHCGVATPDERRVALELALTPLAPSSRGPLLDAVGGAEPHSLGPLSALVVARDGRGVRAAAWAQPCPGRSASFWLPEWAKKRPAGSAEAIEAELVSRAMAIADAAGVSMTQTLFEVPDDPRVGAVESCGFRAIAHLEYLGRTIPPQPLRPPQGVAFEAYAESQRERLKRVMRATYEESLDCPGLEGTRDLDDVLAGYRATGRYDPENWFFVRDAEQDEDIGVLLVADHPDSDQAELVYMGLTPAARGRGRGEAIVAAALRTAANRGAEQLMVAVDAANAPAKNVYQSAGFAAWAERWVYVRRRDGASAS